MKARFKRWNEWRKVNGNSKIHQILVLLGIVPSPTFEIFTSLEELNKIGEAFSKGFSEGLKEGENHDLQNDV